MCRHTFREEAAVSVDHMFTQKPAVAKLIVSLYQLNSVAFGKGQFVGTAGGEVICLGCRNQQVSHWNVYDPRCPLGQPHLSHRSTRATRKLTTETLEGMPTS